MVTNNLCKHLCPHGPGATTVGTEPHFHSLVKDSVALYNYVAHTLVLGYYQCMHMHMVILNCHVSECTLVCVHVPFFPM